MPKFKISKNVSDVGGRIAMVLAVIGLLVIAVLLSGPKPVDYEEMDSGKPRPTEMAGNRPLTPAEIERQKTTRNYSVTSGIIVVAAAVLSIIEIGTLWEMKRQA